MPTAPQAQSLGLLEQQPADPKKASWGPVAAVFVGLGIFIGSQIGVGILLAFAMRAMGWDGDRAESWLTSSVFAQFFFILLAELVAIGGIVWYVRRHKGTLAQLGLTRPRLPHLWMALAGFGIYFVSYIVIAVVTSALVPSLDVEQKQDIGFDNATSQLELLLTFLSLVVLPPLAEEIVFRGFMFAGLRRAWPFVTATFLTSLFFAAGHLLGGFSDEPLLWIAALDTFVLSLVLCTLREKTGSLWPSIYVHAIKNGLAFSVLFLFK